MTNKERLIAHNNLIDTAITKANNLPDAGGLTDHSMEDALIMRVIDTYINDRVGFMGPRAFSGWSTLTEISLASCKSLYSAALQDCVQLRIADFPSCLTISSFALSNCVRLSSINLPSCTAIHNRAFFSCSNLKTIRLPSLETISGLAFQDCHLLQSLILESTSIVTLSQIEAFSGTPMENPSYTGSYGTIYVPSSLVSQYKTATNWSVYADRIKSIDELNTDQDKTLITFEIAGFGLYEAEDGMSWAEWVVSSYNTYDWKVSKGAIEDDEDNVVSGVLPTDLIIANNIYTTYMD